MLHRHAVPCIVLFFIGSLIAWFAFFNFYATFTKMQEQAEKLQASREEEGESQESDSLETASKPQDNTK